MLIVPPVLIYWYELFSPDADVGEVPLKYV
jgi:hypothetical protein